MTMTIDPEATVSTGTPPLLDVLSREPQEFLPMPNWHPFRLHTGGSTATAPPKGYGGERQADRERTRQEAAGGFAAVFQWARRQDFDPDHADRIRREAWGD